MKEILPIVMNTSFERLAVIDDYSSLIWSSRYYTTGDFELCVDVTPRNMSLFVKDYYVVRDDDENVGIIEHIKIQRDEDGKELLIVSGRFLAAILERRIIGQQTTVTGAISSCINTLITQNIINPSIAARKISNFILGSYSISTAMKAQYTGKNLLETISDICETYGLGFKVTLNDQNQFVFQLYEGVDRTYDQSVNPWVIFSDKYDNLLSSEYEENYQSIATAVLVAGEGEGLDRKTMWVASSYTKTGNNLLSNSNVSAYNLSDYSYADGVYNCVSNATFGGLQISSASFLTVGEIYVMTFKIQKTAGTLNNIGGHCAAFTQISFTVDGKEAGSYDAGYALPDDTATHDVIFVGRYNGDQTTNHLYVQPNRGDATSVSFKITDLGVYASQGISDLARHEVYKDQRQIRSDDGEISADEYENLLFESGKESLTKYTTAFSGTVYFDNVKYKEDVDLGDLCVIENSRWGIYLNSRLVEVIESVNEAGEYSIVPTFGL